MPDTRLTVNELARAAHHITMMEHHRIDREYPPATILLVPDGMVISDSSVIDIHVRRGVARALEADATNHAHLLPGESCTIPINRQGWLHRILRRRR